MSSGRPDTVILDGVIGVARPISVFCQFSPDNEPEDFSKSLP